LASVSSEGKRVVVTGAASGIGLAMVDSFLGDGATVVAADLNGQALEELQRRDPGVTTVQADVSSPDDAERIIAAAGERPDVLCNNAGLMDRFALADEVSLEEWNRVFGVNVVGPFLLSKLAIPKMVAQGGGVIINTASIAGIRGAFAGAAYTSAKHALIGLTRNIAATFGSEGIRCNAICPGATGHGAKGAIEPGSRYSERGATRLLGDLETLDIGTPEQIASVAAFLASDAASRINGAVIVADGGRTT
jgi:NAD(P)-dependent dehydrogenase (short-subunit alcohol dehydrogenase family)